MRNPFESMSPGAIRAIYLTAAVLLALASTLQFHQVMFVRPVGNDQCRWTMRQDDSTRLVITDIVRGGVAEKAGLENGDILYRINGKSFRSDFHAQSFINEAIGDSATYSIDRNGIVFETRVRILRAINMSFLAVSLYGYGLFVIGLVVVLARPQGKVQRMFARYGFLTLLFATHLQTNIDPALDGAWRLRLFASMFAVAGVFGPPIFVRFFLHFPVMLDLAGKRSLSAGLYAASVSIVLLIMTSVFAGWPPLSQQVIAWLAFGRYGFIVAGFTFFLYSYLKFVKRERRTSLKPILVGIAAVFAGMTYMSAISAWNPFAAFINPLLLLPALILPVGAFLFGYAIVRYRLMDLNFIVKRGLIYGVVTASVAVIYILTVYAAGNLLSILVGEGENEAVVIVALVVIAFVFDPLKRSTQEWVDRVFYRERVQYHSALLEFAQELPRLINLEQILQAIVDRISSTMHVEGAAVVLCDADGLIVSAEKNIPKSCCAFSNTEGGLLWNLRKTRQPQSFAMLAEDPQSVKISDDDRRMLLESDVMLSVPMFIKDRCIGAINVGKKKSGEIHSEDDSRLRQTVAAQAAIAIENARLHDSELEKEKIQEELSLARTIQQGLLPKETPSIAGLDIEAVSLPALTVGGDYYDFIQISPTRLLVVVADVSGKGMSAALYMSKIQGMIQLAAHMYKTPKEMLMHVNRRIFDGMERRSFITMALALFDLKAKNARICRAGHNPVLVASGSKQEFIKTPGIGLGLERGKLFDKELKETVVQLRSDSLFLFYTDGLTEAMNASKEEFGEKEVLKLVRKYHSRPSREVHRAILEAVHGFQGRAEMHDDLTIVVVKPKASAGRATRGKKRVAD